MNAKHVLICVLTSVGACQTSSEPPQVAGNAAPTPRDSAGIEIVSGHLDPSRRLVLVEQFRMEGTMPTWDSDINGIVETERGEIVLLYGARRQIRVFSEDGTRVQAWNLEGDAEAVAAARDTLLIIFRDRLDGFSMNGERLSSITTPERGRQWLQFWISPTPNGWLTLRLWAIDRDTGERFPLSQGPGPGSARYAVSPIDITTGEVDADLLRHRPVWAESPGRDGPRRSRWIAPQFWASADGAGNVIYSGYSDAYEVTMLSEDGSVERIIRPMWDGPQPRSPLGRSTPNASAGGGFLIARSDLVPSPPEPDDGTVFDVFDGSGHYLGRLTMPFGSFPLSFRGTRIVAAVFEDRRPVAAVVYELVPAA